jgi:tetratricopeptide (TPR) repeat protein
MKSMAWIILGWLTLLTTAHAASLPLNQTPMYGDVEKTQQMKEADASLVASIEKSGYSRESGAKEAVRSAWVAFHKGDMTIAISRFNQAWLLDPENGYVYHGFALVTAQRDRNLPEAEKYFKMALSKKNVSVNAYVDYGRSMWMQNRFDESVVQLQKSLVISPTAFNARSNMSFVYYKKGDFKKACEWAKRAEANKDQLEPGFLDAMCKKAQSY